MSIAGSAPCTMDSSSLGQRPPSSRTRRNQYDAAGALSLRTTTQWRHSLQRYRHTVTGQVERSLKKLSQRECICLADSSKYVHMSKCSSKYVHF